jgi:hypothetical protein
VFTGQELADALSALGLSITFRSPRQGVPGVGMVVAVIIVEKAGITVISYYRKASTFWAHQCGFQ